MAKQSGYTMFELLTGVWLVLCIVDGLALIYAWVHFILKFW